MAAQRTTYVHDGDTYSATFVEAGRGDDSVITVRYNGREMTTPVGTKTASEAARAVLADLVRDRLSGRDRLRSLH